MLFMAANASQSNGSTELRVNSPGILFCSDAERRAKRAMRVAEIAYQKQLGTYRPTLQERFKQLFKPA